MKSLRQVVAEKYINWKARKALKNMDLSVSFPIHATSVKRVLIILPRNLDLLDDASQFVQVLRRTFSFWNIAMFDVDKIPETHLNWLHLPNTQQLKSLQAAKYDLVIDLNDFFDLRSAYISVMSGAPYRVHLRNHDNRYYNIFYGPTQVGTPEAYRSLLEQLQKFFV